jgi:hypothetical protein
MWGSGIRGKSTAKVLTPGQVEVVMWGSGPEICAMGRGPGFSETGGGMWGIGREGIATGYSHLASWKTVCRGSESRPPPWAWSSYICRRSHVPRGLASPTYTLPDGFSYVRELQAGYHDGQGFNIYADGDKKGSCRQGSWHGRGTYTSADGSRYSGNIMQASAMGGASNYLPMGPV